MGLAVLLVLLLDAHSRAGCTQCLPSLDMADYLSRALRIRGAWLNEGLGGAWRELSTADVHPPGHPLLLALWFGLGARGIAQACWLTTLELGLALAALVGLGRALDRERGAWAGLLAAGMTVLSGEHQRLAAATMTEALALCITTLALWALAAHARDGGPKRALAAGVLIAAAGLVRYNIPPMLVAPALVAWTLDRLRRPRELLRIDPLLWVAPTALLLAGWWMVEPKLFVAIGRFLTNVDSGLDPWSAENLLWTPRSFAEHYTLSDPLAALWALAALLGLAAAWRPGAWKHAGEPSFSAVRLVQLFAIVGLVAITLHPYKLSRTLHGVVPFVYLVGALPLTRLPLPRSLPLRLGLLATLIAALGYGVKEQRERLDEPDRLGRLECSDHPEAVEVLDELVRYAEGRRLIALSGSASILSMPAAHLWLLLADSETTVLEDPPTPPDCASLDEWPLPERCVGQAARSTLASPEMAAGDALVITIEKTEGPGGAARGGRKGKDTRRKERIAPVGEHFSVQNARVVAELAREAKLPPLAELTVTARGGTLVTARVVIYGREKPTP